MIGGTGITASLGQFAWNVGSPIVNGTYYICAVFSDGFNSNETYAKWPILVRQNFTNTPRLVLNRSDLNFGIVSRPNATFPLTATSAQTVRVSVVGTGPTPCWRVDGAVPAQNTYVVTLSSGTSQVCGSGSFTIAVNPNSTSFNVLGVGEATFKVREVSQDTTSNSPQYVHAVQRIIAATAATAPFGVVDTPATGTTVSGSIAVTGWANDDVDIASVGIYRDGVGAEGSALIFIGNAVRVDDARPDLAAAFPDTPFNYRSGWGYLLLTNFLPGGGDGSYTLRVIATDVDGHQTVLGSPGIVGANSSATRPFGAIDTPTQGEVVSGSSYNNFGWVLARTPAIASPGFGTPGPSVNVLIDSLVVGSPSGWTARPDLTTLFPAATYPGVSKALGVYTFNPSGLASGVHTIAWLVTADNGLADGIGSRYFTVAGGTGLVLSDPVNGQQAMIAPHNLNPGPDLGRRANSVGVLAASGAKTVLGTALGRVVVDASRKGVHQYDAYLVANNELRALPIGASIDQQRGLLYWQPGVGYTGAYDFVVVRDGKERVPVRVVLQPQRAAVKGPRGLTFRFATEPADAADPGLR